MALADLTFKMYTDAALTTPFSGLYQLTHYTDLSDNPQDFVIYLGSTTIGRTLEATSNPGVDNITLTPTNASVAWASGTAHALGVQRIPTTPNNYLYEVTTAGTTGSSEPTWPTGAIGDTVTDGTVVWTLINDAHQTTEIKLATASSGLTGATGGAALSIGATLTSGTANSFEINIRVTNAVTVVGSNTGYAELSLNVNEVQEAS